MGSLLGTRCTFLSDNLADGGVSLTLSGLGVAFKEIPTAHPVARQVGTLAVPDFGPVIRSLR